MIRQDPKVHQPKVYALTPNPAVDVTYVCPNPLLDEVNRVTDVVHRPGGKGLNVAAVVTALGHRAVAGGFLGGRGGAEIQDLLETSDIQQDWVAIDGETRSTVAIHAVTGTTMFNEPGPRVSTQNWWVLSQQISQILNPGDVLVISGSCPPDTDPTDLIKVLDAAKKAGARTLVDMSGPLLTLIAGHADVVKPNREELLAATGCADIKSGAQALLDAGAHAVIVSDGAAGMSMFTAGDNEFLTAAPPEFVSGNPTGAGDAAAAALAVDLLTRPDNRIPGPQALASAVALSASAVLCPTAGSVDLDAYQKFLPLVTEEYRNATDYAR